MAEALGCYAEYVEEPEDIRPALQRAWKKVEEGMVRFVNVKTGYRQEGGTGGPSRRVIRSAYGYQATIAVVIEPSDRARPPVRARKIPG